MHNANSTDYDQGHAQNRSLVTVNLGTECERTDTVRTDTVSVWQQMELYIQLLTMAQDSRQ